MRSELFATNRSWEPWVWPPRSRQSILSHPDYYGGNMDCVETRPGNEVWFPVLVEGAHFFTGDAHASQGDGELTGVALEIPAKVTVTFELKKEVPHQLAPHREPGRHHGGWQRPAIRGGSTNRLGGTH